MVKIALTACAVILLPLAGMLNAQTIVCDGYVCGGTGVVDCGGIRHYVYRVSTTTTGTNDSVVIGTYDPVMVNYTNKCMPPGWDMKILSQSCKDYNAPSRHGDVSPASNGLCPYTILFYYVSGSNHLSSTPTDFGFDHNGYPHNVNWRIATPTSTSANWTLAVGMGAGPVHGPGRDTNCVGGFIFPQQICLAGRKDNFDTSDGDELSSPSAALLAYIKTVSGGADTLFDATIADRCFGHTFQNCWNDTCGIISAQLCMRITPISGGFNNDAIYLHEEATNYFWGLRLNHLKAYMSGIPADTFLVVGDTLNTCLNLAKMPVYNTSTGSFSYRNLLGMIQDGELDFLMQDDSKIDYLELKVRSCCDTNYFNGIQVVPSTGEGFIRPDTEVIFEVKLTNQTWQYIMGATNGFRVYSPDGATWAPLTWDTAGGIGSYFNTAFSVQQFSNDGVGADTIGWGGVGIPSPPNGIPNGYNDVVLKIKTRVDSDQVGKTICIDSCWYRPSNPWIWALSGGTEYYPDWGGPYCFDIISPSTECALYFSWANYYIPHHEYSYTEKTDLNGSLPVTLNTDFVGAMALDPSGEYIYGTTGGEADAQIIRFGFDGLNPTKILGSPDELFLLGRPNDIALDLSSSSKTIYGSTLEPGGLLGGSAIYKADLPVPPPPGDTAVPIWDGTSWAGPIGGIALDTKGEFIYFTYGNDVYRLSMKPPFLPLTRPPELVRRLKPGWKRQFKGIDLDITTGLMYWADSGCKQILEAPIVPESKYVGFYGQYPHVICETGDNPLWVKVDPCHKQVYWCEGGLIKRKSIGDLTPPIVVVDKCDSATSDMAFALDLSCCQPQISHWATGDINGNGVPLEIADLLKLLKYIYDHDVAPDPLYDADLNGDCIIDSMDVIVFTNYFQLGMSIFDQYGGYPVPTCGDPIPAPIPDTATIFGLSHTSMGNAQFIRVGDSLEISMTGGDTSGQNGVAITLDSIGYWDGQIALTAPSGTSSEIQLSYTFASKSNPCDVPGREVPTHCTSNNIRNNTVFDYGPVGPTTYWAAEGLLNGSRVFHVDSGGQSPSFRFTPADPEAFIFRPFGAIHNDPLIFPPEPIKKPAVGAFGQSTGPKSTSFGNWAYCVNGVPVPGIDYATRGPVDEIRFYSENPDFEMESFDGIFILTKGFDTIRVIGETAIPPYVCGDANGNGIVNLLDITFMINYLYKHGAAPNPLRRADVNSSGNINALDITYMINYLYKHGKAPNCI